MNNIKVINLVRRHDRKICMTKQFAKHNIIDYEFVEAIDGKTIKPSQSIYNMFKHNEFGFRKGVIGCALSHMTLFMKLLYDNENEYYIIFEDDVEFVDDFKNKLELCCKHFEKTEMDFLLLGAFTLQYPNVNTNELKIASRHLIYNDGLHGYMISKNGAKKILEFVQKNGLRLAIDSAGILNHIFNNKIQSVNEYLVSQKGTNIYLDKFSTDTDVQNSDDCFDFPPEYELMSLLNY